MRKYIIMKRFDYTFNKIFILESLGEADTYADSLYRETIEPCCRMSRLATEPPIKIYNRSDWDKAIEKILQDKHQFPLIHFEMHGDENEGLFLRLGDFVPWPDVIQDLTKINIRSQYNLIISMAVCYSSRLAFNISMVNQRAPYLFSVSTRLKVCGKDTYKLFSVFFKELIKTGELYAALKQVEKTNPDLPPKFDILAVPYLFVSTFKNYFMQHQNISEIEREFYHIVPEMQEREMSEEEFRNTKKGFVTIFDYEVNKIYQRYRDLFFMIDLYPDNKQRFNLPDSINDL